MTEDEIRAIVRDEYAKLSAAEGASNLDFAHRMLGGKMDCPQCHMVWEGAMGYVCPQVDCPIQPRATC